VLISDIAMPGRDGFALMQTLNEHPAKKAGRIVSVALTGLSDPLHARRALQEGFDVCMVKPLDLGRLIEYVATAVRRSAEHSRK
jgi:CheY-like chemotaxis protein